MGCETARGDPRSQGGGQPRLARLLSRVAGSGWLGQLDGRPGVALHASCPGRAAAAASLARSELWARRGPLALRLAGRWAPGLLHGWQHWALDRLRGLSGRLWRPLNAIRHELVDQDAGELIAEGLGIVESGRGNCHRHGEGGSAVPELTLDRFGIVRPSDFQSSVYTPHDIHLPQEEGFLGGAGLLIQIVIWVDQQIGWDGLPSLPLSRQA